MEQAHEKIENIDQRLQNQLIELMMDVGS